MSEKKAPAKTETGTVNYVNPRQEDAPFSLKVGEHIIKPIIQPDDSYIWSIPKEILNQALRHSFITTGRLISEK
tara:strand:+ start:174 stop:395 length:222 start_codon:yes stop_codon:yes gene_type:complete